MPPIIYARRATVALLAIVATLACYQDRPPSSSRSTQAPGAPTDPALAQVMAYHLTSAGLDRWAAAQRNLKRVTDSDTTIVRSLRAQSPPKSIDDMIARIDGEPKLRAAITDAGLSTRDFMFTTLVLAHTMQALALQKTGRLPATAPETERENIAVVQENLPHIRELMGLPTLR
jgi:hypothetical protein